MQTRRPLAARCTQHSATYLKVGDSRSTGQVQAMTPGTVILSFTVTGEENWPCRALRQSVCALAYGAAMTGLELAHDGESREEMPTRSKAFSKPPPTLSTPHVCPDMRPASRIKWASSQAAVSNANGPPTRVARSRAPPCTVAKMAGSRSTVK
jgi:hypothetical protein